MRDQIRSLGWDVYLGALGIAAVLLALPLVRPEINRIVHVPEMIYIAIAVIGSALALVGLGGIVVLILSLSLSRSATWCESRPISKRDVRLAFDLMRQFFGEETPTCNRMLEWQRRNKMVLSAVYVKSLRRGVTKKKLVGVFKVLPLTAGAVALLESEKKTGATLGADCITTEGEEAAALYIGDVVATTRKGKAEVLRQLQHVVQQQMKPGLCIYTRPLTVDGMRLVRKYKFLPIMKELQSGALGRMHRLEISDTLTTNQRA